MRAQLVEHLESLIKGSDALTAHRHDEYVGSLKTKPGLRRSGSGSGLLRIDHAAIKNESHLDGKWLLRTPDATLTTQHPALAYKQLIVAGGGT